MSHSLQEIAMQAEIAAKVLKSRYGGQVTQNDMKNCQAYYTHALQAELTHVIDRI